jgi:hypothetical protein
MILFVLKIPMGDCEYFQFPASEYFYHELRLFGLPDCLYALGVRTGDGPQVKFAFIMNLG